MVIVETQSLFPSLNLIQGLIDFHFSPAPCKEWMLGGRGGGGVGGAYRATCFAAIALPLQFLHGWRSAWALSISPYLVCKAMCSHDNVLVPSSVALQWLLSFKTFFQAEFSVHESGSQKS